MEVDDGGSGEREGSEAVEDVEGGRGGKNDGEVGSGVYFLGLMVQVLHEDGKWYNGQLTEYDSEKNSWHILFDDGDKDWYALPHRDVRVLREKQNRIWDNFLRRLRAQGQTRECIRDTFSKQLQEEERPPRRRPAGVFGPDAHVEEVNLERWQPLSANTFLTDGFDKAEGDADGVRLAEDSTLGKRRREDLQLPEKIRSVFLEGRMYAQLSELERRVDTITARKRMEFAQEIKTPRMTTRVLQIIVFNTHTNQNGDEPMGDSGGGNQPSWALHITGRLLGEDGSSSPESEESQRPFTDFFDRIFIQLPQEEFPENSAVSWIRGKRNSDGSTDDGLSSTRGFKLVRDGSEECTVRVMLHPHYAQERYSLKGTPELAALLKWEGGTWPQLLVAFWAYVRNAGLQDENNSLYIRLNEQMRNIFGEDRIALKDISDKLAELATEMEPIELEYKLSLTGRVTPSVFEVLVDVEDPIVAQMREFLDESQHQRVAKVCSGIEEEIADLIDEIDERKRRRDFMKSFSETPITFLNDITCSLALDLKRIRSAGSVQYTTFTPEEMLRSHIWQQPWTEESVLHYLNMQGYDVMLNMENTLGEEDAIMHASNALAAKYVNSAIASGQIDRSQAASYSASIITSALGNSQYYGVLALPGSGAAAGGKNASASMSRGGGGRGGDGADEETFYCQPCDRVFKSQHALAVHYATSTMHKKEKDQNEIKKDVVGTSSNASTTTLTRPAQSAGGYSMWNEIQKLHKGKGYSTEQLKDIYKTMQSQQEKEKQAEAAVAGERATAPRTAARQLMQHEESDIDRRPFRWA